MLVTGATTEMRIAQADIFAPVLALMEARSHDAALSMNESCSYALTAAVFGEEREALALAAKVTAGTVMVNDLIVPGADPRTPFGGRKSSGFGVTQGAEGLLEMTAPKTVAVRRGSGTNQYEATTPAHEAMFKGVIQASHLSGWRARMAGLKQVLSAANDLKNRK
jgi:aldehyde dehydrogenase (NAD+)